MEWKDQGYANRKGWVGLFATVEPARIGSSLPVGHTTVAPHDLTAFSMTLELTAGVEDLNFRYVVGGGGGHSLTINKFVWSWLPASPSSPPSPPSPPNPPPAAAYVYKGIACVLGNNIAADTGGHAYPGSTVDECKTRCDTYGDDCKGFEIGLGPDTHYGIKPGDCRLQSSAVTTGCNGAAYNVDFYEKVFPPPSQPPPQAPPIIAYWGGNNHCDSLNRCSIGQGDCDSDTDCQDGLLCFQRTYGEAVPGVVTAGSNVYDVTDICYNPSSD